jgi:hypothetical protein
MKLGKERWGNIVSFFEIINNKNNKIFTICVVVELKIQRTLLTLGYLTIVQLLLPKYHTVFFAISLLSQWKSTKKRV